MAVDINEEIARLHRRDADERRTAAARPQEGRQEQARQTAARSELNSLGQNFVRWARAASIEPEFNAHDEYQKTFWGGQRKVTVTYPPYGWSISSFSESHNHMSGCYSGWGGINCHVHGNTLLVRISGDVEWMHNLDSQCCPEITVDYVRRSIAEYIYKSGSRHPWRD
jgi:hypothetical protein